MYLSGIALLILGAFSLFESYQLIKHNRTYWAYPTLVGFHTRKIDKGPRWFALFEGLSALLCAIFLLSLGVRCLFG